MRFQKAQLFFSLKHLSNPNEQWSPRMEKRRKFSITHTPTLSTSPEPPPTLLSRVFKICYQKPLTHSAQTKLHKFIHIMWLYIRPWNNKNHNIEKNDDDFHPHRISTNFFLDDNVLIGALNWILKFEGKTSMNEQQNWNNKTVCLITN